jgi:hypothetical protein
MRLLDDERNRQLDKVWVYLTEARSMAMDVPRFCGHV